MKEVEVEVKVELNLKRLLDQEDLNQDLKITVEDKGPKHFLLEDLRGKLYEVSGTYHLSNLLQTLAYAHQAKKVITKIKAQDVFLNPVEHLSKEIKERYWDALTRTLDEEGIVALLEDPKTDQNHAKRIYVPYEDVEAYEAFKEIAQKHTYLHLEIVRLPKEINLETHRALDHRPGVLTLAWDGKGGRGKPFVVPGGRFNEMYGWDSYFILLGLLEDQKLDLALSMIDHFVYEIKYYGAILNANRTYYLSRSQPPLFTSMIQEVLRKLPDGPETQEWLKEPLDAAIEEYLGVWMHENRVTDNGLNRYFGLKLKEPPEVEPGHFNSIYSRFAKKAKVPLEQFMKGYRSGEIQSGDLDTYFVHDRAMRESGHDTTNRLVGCCADLNTVDLNSLLYKVEEDIATLIRKYFEGSFTSKRGQTFSSEEWESFAQKRKERMSSFMWHEEKGLFFDYNTRNKEKHLFESVTTFYPLFAHLATSDQAKSLIEMGLPLFEKAGGLVSTTKASRGAVSEDRPQRQWDYPFGWAPHQILFWKGVSQYGYKGIARRLAYRWLYMLTIEASENNGLLAEKYDVIRRSHKADVEYGNVGVDFGLYPDGGFGWVNASYQVGLSYLSDEEKGALKSLTPPEWVFK